ncbi:MAG: HEPN domain-containing protein [Flavobacteriales bacterium]|nr:HEPN domain-containing protein [Flavobacteriales bacterium]
MNTSISHLPEKKQTELTQLTETLSSFKEVEMVILFGSYARGNWVEDQYVEKDVLFEYRSDYDILVVTTHEDLRRKYKIEDKVKAELVTTGKVVTPLGLIFHGIKQLNQSLQLGNYFFKDIKEEGVVLYDSEKFKLANPKKLTTQQSKDKAQNYYNQWFTSASDFYDDYEVNLEKERFLKSAFYLHQAVEQFYTTILLVFTDYRPKDHNIETLSIKIEMCDKRFDVFPKETDEEKRLFELLKSAYIDARYNMDEFSITKEELEYLAEKVNLLKDATEKICEEKIASFK